MKIDLSGKDGLEERWLPINDDSPKYCGEVSLNIESEEIAKNRKLHPKWTKDKVNFELRNSYFYAPYIPLQ